MTKELPAQETRTVYGLRLRGTGEMLRVRTDSAFFEDGDLRYTLTTEPDCPLFDAEYEDGYRTLFVNPRGSSERRPLLGEFKPDDIEPVVFTEVISRQFRVPDVVFERHYDLPGAFATDIGAALMRSVDGLGDLVDIVTHHADDLRAVKQGKEGWDSGAFHLVALIVPGKPETLPSMETGALIASTWNERRFLAAFEIPGEFLRAPQRGKERPEHGTLVACLGDGRKLPEGLVEAIKERFAAETAPSP